MARPARQHVSIIDVAKAAGVSTQTVSRVLNDVPTVQPENRQRVLDAVRTLGYQPNIAARMLKQRRYKTIGVAMYDTFATGPITVVNQIARAAQDAGHLITLVNFEDSSLTDCRPLLYRLATMPVDGVILLGGWTNLTGAQGEPLLTDRPATVVTPFDQLPYTTVGTRPRAYVDMAIAYLVERGHRSIYHLAGPERSAAAVIRAREWKRALETRGLPVHTPYLGDWTADSGYAIGRELANDPACTAVYVSNDAMAYGLLLGLESAGRRVPEDVSIIGTDDSLGGIVPNLNLTTISLFPAELGKLAVEETLKSIEEPDRAPVHRVVHASLVERGTVRSL